MNRFNNSFYLRTASYLSVFVALFSLSAKSYAYYKTGSSSVLASLADSFLDITTSIINMLAIKFILTPPDDDHRFGHEKFGDLAVFGQGIFFIASGVFVFISSIYNFYLNKSVLDIETGVTMMAVSTIFTVVLVMYQTFVFRRTKSKIIEADRLHYMTDLISNIAVIVSIYFSSQFYFIDSLVGILISIMLIKGSFDLLSSSFKNLVDQEFDEENQKILYKLIKDFLKNTDAISAHDIKTRTAGKKSFIQFHLEFDGDMKLKDVHEITEALEQIIMKKFPASEVIIHQDPKGSDEKIMFSEDVI
jgi:ferrous-iron efflux pump FieF